MFFEAVAVAALALRASAQAAGSTGTVVVTATTPSSDTSAQTTISAFVNSGLEGSVVSANPCTTVLAVACNDDSNILCDQVSQYGATEITFTQMASGIELDYSTSVEGYTVAIGVTCDYSGTAPTWTEEICTVSASVSGQGTSTKSTTVVSTSTAITQEALPITAGAQNLPSAGATCTASEGAAAPTANSQVYKVLVPVVIAGAGAFL